MIKHVWIAVIFALLLAAVGVAQKTKHRVSAKVDDLPLEYRASQGDAQAQAEIVRMAAKGDPQAQRELGDNYEDGIWVPKDHSEALRWYRKAAEQGDVIARDILGQMYFEGKKENRDFDEAARWLRCPKPSGTILAGCTEITYGELPQGAVDLLLKMRCEVARKVFRGGSNYDDGSAVDLSGKGTPAYEICCGEAPHGPCSAVIIGKVGSQWKELSGNEVLEGFSGACNGLIVLESEHNGYHDICLPSQCSMLPPQYGDPCVPTIWQFNNGHYRSVPNTTAKPQP